MILHLTKGLEFARDTIEEIESLSDDSLDDGDAKRKKDSDE